MFLLNYDKKLKSSQNIKIDNIYVFKNYFIITIININFTGLEYQQVEPIVSKVVVSLNSSLFGDFY